MKRFLQLSWLSFKGTNSVYSGEEFIFLQVFQPFLVLIFYVLLASYSMNPVDLTSWVIGNSFLMCINTTIFTLGSSFNQERFYGRLKSIVTSPTNTMVVVLHKCFFPSIVSIVVVLIGLIFGGLLFNVTLDYRLFPVLIIIIFISMLAASSFGLFLSTFGLISDSMHLVLNVVSSGIIILSGANFPISQLPRVFQVISYMMPLRNGLNGAFYLMSGEYKEMFLLLTIEIIVCLFYLTSSVIIFNSIERYSRIKATLEIY